MPKKTYPLLSQEKTFLPRGEPWLCPQCGQKPVDGEPLPMILAGGAMQKTGPETYGMTPPDIYAFLHLDWHTHTSEQYASLDVAALVAGGQFEIYFCSPACLRAFFNELMDEFEQRLENSRRSFCK